MDKFTYKCSSNNEINFNKSEDETKLFATTSALKKILYLHPPKDELLIQPYYLVD